MRVIGIDPGIEKTGFAIVEKHGEKIEIGDHGCIKTERGSPLSTRLLVLAHDLKSVLRKWKPQAAGIEQLFFSRNVKTAMTVSHARGVILEVLEENSVPVIEFNPAHIKSAITGDSKADKLQIQKMLRFTLGVTLKNDDTADALACGLCTLFASEKNTLVSA